MVAIVRVVKTLNQLTAIMNGNQLPWGYRFEKSLHLFA